jgi:hypothetical protein
MARSAVTVSEMLLFNTAYDVTADAVDLTEDHSIDVSDMNHSKVLIRFAGATTAMTVTIKAGDFSDSTIGDLEVAVGTTDIKVIVVESSRFLQNDGTILIDTASTGAVTGATIEAYLLP